MSETMIKTSGNPDRILSVAALFDGTVSMDWLFQLTGATVEQVREAARRWLCPDEAPLVVTGGRTIQPQLEELFPGRVSAE